MTILGGLSSGHENHGKVYIPKFIKDEPLTSFFLNEIRLVMTRVSSLSLLTVPGLRFSNTLVLEYSLQGSLSNVIGELMAVRYIKEKSL